MPFDQDHFFFIMRVKEKMLSDKGCIQDWLWYNFIISSSSLLLIVTMCVHVHTCKWSHTCCSMLMERREELSLLLSWVPGIWESNSGHHSWTAINVNWTISPVQSFWFLLEAIFRHPKVFLLQNCIGKCLNLHEIMKCLSNGWDIKISPPPLNSLFLLST